MGGGFGSKLGTDVQVVIAARLASEADAPVKIMLDRKHEHLITGNRPSAFAKVKAGVDAQGKVRRLGFRNVGYGRRGRRRRLQRSLRRLRPAAGRRLGFRHPPADPR